MSYTEVEVEEASLIITPELMPELGTPFRIKAESDGFLLYDSGQQVLIKFDTDGKKMMSFGKEGRGPGEHQTISGFWKFDDYYLVYDFNSSKFITFDHIGNFIEDTLIESDEFPWFSPVAIEVITPYQFVIPTLGENESLFKLVDLKENRVNYLGSLVGDYVKDMSSEEIRQAISSRQVPGYMKNNVTVSSNQTGIFSFQQTTAILEKYSDKGELIWERNLKIPAIQGLFEHFFNENIPFFHYAQDFHAYEEGVAVLLHLLEDQPVSVIWIPNSGDDIQVVSFAGIKKQPRSFSISVENSLIYFVNTIEGEVHKAKWPELK